MDKNGFDERQILNRYKIGFQSFLLTVCLVLLDAFLRSAGFHWADGSDGEILIALVVIAFFSVKAIWNDAFYTEKIAFRMNLLMILFTILAVYLIADFAHNVSAGAYLIKSSRLTRECVNLAAAAYTAAIAIVYWIKRVKSRHMEE